MKGINIGCRTPIVTSLLGLIFITLKLCNVITWSWWWVLSPFWITWIAAAILAIIIAVILLAVER